MHQENIPLYVLAIGIMVWSLALIPSNSYKTCNGVKEGEIIAGGLTAIKRTGPWGESCNFWVTDGEKEFVIKINKKQENRYAKQTQ